VGDHGATAVRRAAAALLVAVAVVLAACGGGGGRDAGSTGPEYGLAAVSLAPTATTTTTQPAATPVVLPVPVRPPDPDSYEPYVVLGTIEIPRIGLVAEMAEGITLGTLDKGPGHWPGTPMPGGVGNMVVAGHRVTHTRPFRHLDDLAAGDEVIFTVGGVRHVYRVVGDEIVTSAGMHIIEQTPARTATLFACHPPGSARYRYVVHLELAA
jgi:sortase A